MSRKIMLLRINWETNEARYSFVEGENAFQRAESVMDLEEKRDPDKKWVQSMFFGPGEEDD